MTTSTTSTDVEFRMGTKALLAAAMTKTASGNLTIGAKRARNEIARRDAKAARSTTPVAAPVAAPIAEPIPVEVIVDLATQARKEITRLARLFAADDAANNGGTGFVRFSARWTRDLHADLARSGAESFLSAARSIG